MLLREGVSSPNSSLEILIMAEVVNTKQEYYAMNADVTNAFIQTDMNR